MNAAPNNNNNTGEFKTDAIEIGHKNNDFLACNKSILNFEFCQDRTTTTISFKIEYLKIPLDYNDDIAIIFM